MTNAKIALALPRHNADLWKPRQQIINEWIAAHPDVNPTDLLRFADEWGRSRAPGFEFDDARMNHIFRREREWARDLANALIYKSFLSE